MIDQVLQTITCYGVVALISGCGIAAISLANKYPTCRRYAFRSIFAWLFVTFCALGALLFTCIMHSVGTKIISHPILDQILLGVLGAASFAGIVSRFHISVGGNKDIDAHIKTIRDFVYGFLDDSISRRVTQLIETRLKGLPAPSNVDTFLNEVGQLIDALSISKSDKDQWNIQFDEWAVRGNYRSIIRELIRFYDVDYVILRLSEGSSTNQTEITSVLNAPPLQSMDVADMTATVSLKTSQPASGIEN